MNLSNLVSVVIPCFNAATTVERAVKSALDNAPLLHQIILVDNASNDDTLKVCTALKNLHRDKIKITVEPKPGACHARNTGLLLVETDWVQFLDADDWIAPNKFESQVSFGNQESVDVVVSPFAIVDRKGRHSKSLFPQMPAQLGLMRGCLGTTGANLFRTSAVRAVAGWNPLWSSAQEYELMFRLLQNNANFGVLGLSLFEYSSGVSDSISSGDSFSLKSNSLRLRRSMLEEFLPQGWSNTDKQALMNGLFMQVRWTLPVNPDLALANWKYLRSLNYWPTSDLHLPVSYCLLVRFFGLEFSENLRRRIQKIKR